MQFLEHVRDAWSLLPAFRAVAETEHLPTAARELDLVPSSLSRSIRQLEEIIGVELFDHSGKSLALNDHGRTLLAAVRVAMRHVDEAVRSTSGQELEGNVVLAIVDQLPSSLVGQACTVLRREHPELAVSTLGVAEGEVDSLLLRGVADVAVVTCAERDGELSVVELSALRRGAYVSRKHRHDHERPFVALGSRHAPVPDGWPLGRPRRIAMWAHCERIAIEMCLQGGVAVVATEHAVAMHVDRLERLPITGIADQQLFLAFRRPLGVHARTEAVVTTIVATLRESHGQRVTA